jgi:hypothetical protein
MWPLIFLRGEFLLGTFRLDLTFLFLLFRFFRYTQTIRGCQRRVFVKVLFFRSSSDRVDDIIHINIYTVLCTVAFSGLTANI